MKKRYEIKSYEELKKKLLAVRELGLKYKLYGKVKKLIWDKIEDPDADCLKYDYYTDFDGFDSDIEDYIKEDTDPVYWNVKYVTFNRGKAKKKVQVILSRHGNFHMVDYATVILYIDED